MQTRNSKSKVALAIAALMTATMLTGCGGDPVPYPPPGVGYGYPGYGAGNCASAGGEPVRRDGQPYYGDLAGSNGGSIQLQLFYVNRLDDNYVQNVNATATVNLPQLSQMAPGGANPQASTFCVTTTGLNGVNAPGQLFRDWTLSVTLKGQAQLPGVMYSPYGGGYGGQPGYGGYGQPPVMPVDVVVEIGKVGYAGVAQQRVQGLIGIRVGQGGNVYQAQ